jgi:gamma-glutamyltranspeptidase
MGDPSMASSRYAAAGRRWAVATPHAAATSAAVETFEAGGNAVDAAITANAVLAVVYPHMCGIGGDLFAVVADARSRAVVNGSGAAALALDAERMRQVHAIMPPQGPLSVSVPGTVAAWHELATRFGRRPLADAIGPAIGYAHDGVPVSRSVARAIAKHRDRIAADAGLRALLLAGGRPAEEKDVLRQPALAGSLRAILTGGSAAMYDGPLGARLLAGLNALGSPLTAEDFRRHATEVVAPLVRPYRRHQVLVPPPNSQGFVLQEILGCLERGGVQPDHLGSQASLLVRLFLLASGDRDRLLADPRRAPVPIEELLSADHARELIAQARADAMPGPVGRAASGDTVGIVAADAGGLWVSINQSLYDAFGSGILEPKTGIILHNRGSGFSLDPRSPNRLEGGKRPAHTLMPVMALDRGAPAIASATMGRNAHAQIHAELLMAVIDQGLQVFEAVDRPRWLAGGLRAEATGVVAESRVPEAVIAGFTASGIEVERLEDWDEQVGHAQLIARGPDGQLQAASDPRADGAAACG